MRIGFLLAASVGLIAAMPASAAVSILNNSVTVSGSGGTFSVDYDGWNGANFAGLSTRIDFTFVNITNAGKTFNFQYQIHNDSTINSRVSVFGMLNSGTLAGATGASPFATSVLGNPNVPNFAGPISVCFKPGGQTNNCNNGGNGTGVFNGTSSALGSFALTLQNSATQMTLSNLFVRYQSVGPNRNDSAIGRGTFIAVPEPATWAMMIGGFGLIGAAARRRRGHAALA